MYLWSIAFRAWAKSIFSSKHIVGLRSFSGGWGDHGGTKFLASHVWCRCSTKLDYKLRV